MTVRAELVLISQPTRCMLGPRFDHSKLDPNPPPTVLHHGLGDAQWLVLTSVTVCSFWWMDTN